MRERVWSCGFFEVPREKRFGLFAKATRTKQQSTVRRSDAGLHAVHKNRSPRVQSNAIGDINRYVGHRVSWFTAEAYWPKRYSSGTADDVSADEQVSADQDRALRELVSHFHADGRGGLNSLTIIAITNQHEANPDQARSVIIPLLGWFLQGVLFVYASSVSDASNNLHLHYSSVSWVLPQHQPDVVIFTAACRPDGGFEIPSTLHCRNGDTGSGNTPGVSVRPTTRRIRFCRSPITLLGDAASRRSLHYVGSPLHC